MSIDRASRTFGAWFVQAVAGCLLLGGSPSTFGQAPRATYQVSGTERPTPRQPVLLDEGALVAVAMDFEDEHVALHSTHALGAIAAPVWRSDLVGAHGPPLVAAASSGKSVAALAQFLVPGSTTERETLVRAVRAHDGTIAWSYTFPGTTRGAARIAMSRDGREIVAARALAGGPVELARIDAMAATVHSSPIVFTDGLRQVSFSGDGSSLLLSGSLRDHVVDLTTGIATELGPRNASTDAVRCSWDARRVARAAFGSVSVLERLGTRYQPRFEFTVASTLLGTQLALTDDGSTLAVAYWNTVDQRSVKLHVLDVDAGRLLWERDFTSSSSLQNLPVALRFDATGGTLAFAQWGDDGGPLPEVVVFEAGTGREIFAARLSGSPLGIDLSPDGRVLVVATKPTHANRFAEGGEILVHDLGEPRDDVEGAPLLGTTIALRAPGDAGTPVAFLTGAVTTGITLPGIDGELLLDPNRAWALGFEVADALGDARFTVALPPWPELAGRRVPVQALALSLGGRPAWRPLLSPLLLR